MTESTAVWLYGSAARGDSGIDSDIDVLVISPELSTELLELNNFDKEKLSVSRYTWNEIKYMSKYGSLYLHHIKSEGRPIEEGIEVKGLLASVLDDLPHYKNANRDIKSFIKAIGDIEFAISIRSPLEFELSTLAIVMRHASILACHIANKPCYGRAESFERAINELNLADTVTMCFRELYQYRLFAEGRISQPEQVDIEQVKKWLVDCKLILETIRGKLQ